LVWQAEGTRLADDGVVKVVVFSTSYPAFEGDFAGRFVADAVERLRAREVDVDVVTAGDYRTFGIARDGGGLPRALAARPWLVPPVVGSMVVALRRAARDADLVHAHWLAGAAIAMQSRRPFVVTLHGSSSAGRMNDFALCRSAPSLVRLILNRASGVICVSESLARAVRRAGVEAPRVIANGVDLPTRIGREAKPAEVLFVGRLAPEKGIEEFVAASHGLRVVVAGDGPLRARVPNALGFVSPERLSELYARAAVVVCPSRAEGFGLVCAEAMSHGRAVVACSVGGLLDLVEDGVTGLLVPPCDPVALREAIDRLLGDDELRRRLGTAARERVVRLCSWNPIIDATLEVYRRAAANVAAEVPLLTGT